MQVFEAEGIYLFRFPRRADFYVDEGTVRLTYAPDLARLDALVDRVERVFL